MDREFELDKSLPLIEQYRVAERWLDFLNENMARFEPPNDEWLMAFYIMDEIWCKLSDVDCKILEDEAREKFKDSEKIMTEEDMEIWDQEVKEAIDKGWL